MLACLAIDAGKRALQVQASSWRVQDVDLPTTADAAITIHRPLKSAWPDSHRLKTLFSNASSELMKNTHL